MPDACLFTFPSLHLFNTDTDKTLLFLPVIVSLKWSSRGLLAITYISCFLYSTDLWPNALLFSWLHFPFLVSPLSSKFFYVITLNLISPLVLLPYSSAVPNCQVFILENCWTGQNILGHDYKRKRGELRSTDLWIPHLLNAGDLSFGISIIWKLHQIHFVFFFIVLGY